MPTDKNLVIQIKANTENFNNRLKEARSETEKLQQQFSSISKKAAVGFAAATTAAGLTVKAFASYEQALIGVAKTTGLAGKDLTDFSKGIDKLSRTIPNLSPKELLNLAQTAGQLGIQGKDNLLKFTETYAKLGTATNIAGEEGAAAIARLLNVTGDGVETIDTFGATITGLGNATAASEAEILGMATRVGQSTTQFELGTTAVLGISAALKEVGVEAELGGTAIGRTFLEIQNAVFKGGEGLESFSKITGKTGEELKQVFEKDATAAFTLFIDSLSKLPAEEVSVVLENMNLSGARLRSTIGTLAKRSDILTKSLKLANEEAEKGTALNNEFAAASKALNSQFGLAKNAVLEFSKNIGKELAPTVTTIIKSFTNFINKINDLGQGTAKTIAGILKWITVATGLTVALGVLGTAVLVLRNGMVALGIASKAAFGKLSLIISAVSLAAVGFNKLKDAIGNIGSTESELAKVGDKIDDLRNKEEKYQIKVNKGLNIFKAGNQEKLDAIQKEIAQQEGLQAVLEKELEQRKKINEASLRPDTMAEKPAAEGGAAIGAEAGTGKIENAKKEAEQLQDIRSEANKKEVEELRQKHELIKELQQIKLEEELLQEELKNTTKGSARESDLEAELAFLAEKRENLLEHQELLSEIEIEYQEGKKERDDIYNELSDEDKKGRDEKEIEDLKSKLKTKEQLEKQNADRTASRINQENRRFLEMQRKHGKTVATLDKSLNNSKVAGTQQTLKAISALTESENSKMKAIGKVAALTDIAISTAKGALQAYASAQWLPYPSNLVAGGAAAALVTAAGVQNAAKVNAAAKGGIVRNGARGIDDQPFMLTRGEAVTPADVTPALLNTFEELRNIRNNGGLLDTLLDVRPNISSTVVNNNTGNSFENIDEEERGNINVTIAMEDDAADIFTAQQRENDNLNIGIITA
jgi:TP901 family phage tail tape measure protein